MSIFPSASGDEQRPNSSDPLTWLRAEAQKPLCECGEPGCVYVANLATVLENLRGGVR